MNDLVINNVVISKTYITDHFWFHIANRVVLIPKQEDVSIYCDEENEGFEIKIRGTHGITLENIAEAREVAKYLGLTMWRYEENDTVEAF